MNPFIYTRHYHDLSIRLDSDPARHKETAHYARWRDAVAPLMAEPRSSAKFLNVFPEDAGW